MRFEFDKESLFLGVLLGIIFHAIIMLVLVSCHDSGFTDKQLNQLQYICKEVKNEMGN